MYKLPFFLLGFVLCACGAEAHGINPPPSHDGGAAAAVESDEDQPEAGKEAATTAATSPAPTTPTTAAPATIVDAAAPAPLRDGAIFNNVPDVAVVDGWTYDPCRAFDPAVFCMLHPVNTCGDQGWQCHIHIICPPCK